MARKPSVILTANERKSAQNALKTYITQVKDLLKAAKADHKAAGKTVADYEKQLAGLTVRSNALKPAPKAPVV